MNTHVGRRPGNARKGGAAAAAGFIALALALMPSLTWAGEEPSNPEESALAQEWVTRNDGEASPDAVAPSSEPLEALIERLQDVNEEPATDEPLDAIQLSPEPAGIERPVADLPGARDAQAEQGAGATPPVEEPAASVSEEAEVRNEPEEPAEAESLEPDLVDEDAAPVTTELAPFASEGEATIRIDAAAIRGANTKLAGIQYTLHEVLGNGSNNNPYHPGAASAFSCTIPANASSCTITVTGVDGSKSWFLAQGTNGDTYANPQYRLNNFSNPQDVFYYVGRTVALESGRDYLVPGGTTSGRNPTAGLATAGKPHQGRDPCGVAEQPPSRTDLRARCEGGHPDGRIHLRHR